MLGFRDSAVGACSTAVLTVRHPHLSPLALALSLASIYWVVSHPPEPVKFRAAAHYYNIHMRMISLVYIFGVHNLLECSLFIKKWAVEILGDVRHCRVQADCFLSRCLPTDQGCSCHCNLPDKRAQREALRGRFLQIRDNMHSFPE